MKTPFLGRPQSTQAETGAEIGMMFYARSRYLSANCAEGLHADCTDSECECGDCHHAEQDDGDPDSMEGSDD